MPMSEEPWLVLSNRCQPCPRPLGFAPQSFELLHCPSDQMLVDAHCNGLQLGAIEDPVIVDPTSHLGIDLPSESGQVRAAAAIEAPVPDLLVDRLGRIGTDGRIEAHEEPLLAEHRAPPEGVAEEVEAGVLEVPSAPRVLAEHELRLCGVQLESKGPEPFSDGSPKITG